MARKRMFHPAACQYFICFAVILLLLLGATAGCSSQKEEQARIKTVVDLFFSALQQENHKEEATGLTERGSTAEALLAKESLYIGKLIQQSTEFLQIRHNYAEVEVNIQFNDGFRSLDHGNRVSKEVVILTLVKKKNEWKISRIEKG
ncbi:hypothetical protein [Paenibacillus silviterrae]|uniref:hypothetical protein n=1 Tax=Paenibacillus silviterrae TaxID=3242194 RepID=UPI002542F3BA|nr:hypothetical protein [Paenibacillus chinjuensis]